MWKQERMDGKGSMLDDVEGSGLPSQPSMPETGDDVSAFVGKGVSFKGIISYSGTVRIDGTLDGEIHTEGVLLIGEEAVITAKVTAGTIVCKGKITGEITANEKIKLRAPAVINGGVTTPMLSIEEGVLFNGTLEMTQGQREASRDTTLHAVGLPGPSAVRKVS
jgi:cytoskeletal protein CcmA (bactofilin family)